MGGRCRPDSGLACQIHSRTEQACQRVDDRIKVQRGICNARQRSGLPNLFHNWASMPPVNDDM